MIFRPAPRTQITRRDLKFALLGAFIAAIATTVAFSLAIRPTVVRADAQVMHSMVFDWNTFTDKPTKVGSTRSVVSSPTATLENLEIHVTTLNPGLMPHPPHRHPNEEAGPHRPGHRRSLQ